MATVTPFTVLLCLAIASVGQGKLSLSKNPFNWHSLFINGLTTDANNRNLQDNCFVSPVECPNKNITFYLFNSPGVPPVILDPGNTAALLAAPWKPNAPVKVIIHGFAGNADDLLNGQTRVAYLGSGEYNLITVDYGPLVLPPCYLSSVKNVPLVGQCVAQLIDRIVAHVRIPLHHFHIIGWSLGGQVSGHISNYLTSGKLTRITGLDPANPMFNLVPESGRLDASDADFVDVVHTNAGQSGKIQPCGDVDIYVNNGTQQPACPPGQIGGSSCAHFRAPIIFGESITTKVGFYAYSCPSVGKLAGLPCINRRSVLMGEHIDTRMRGIFFLETNETPPWAKGPFEHPKLG